MRANVWRGCSVLVTGHTGFKGSWLSLWLNSLGAKVHGYSLGIPTEPSLFEVARVASILETDSRGDLANLPRLDKVLEEVQPVVVFHLAAQSLVREGYRDPIGTFVSNVIGTAKVLEAVREKQSIRAGIVITTDKVYENKEWFYPYREVDTLGGQDPYSASKSAAEIVTASYRESYFSSSMRGYPCIATARAGNVIGGGDWAQDRLIPDCLRAFASSVPVRLRYPEAVRPWQHVLEPLAGYLLLAEALLGSSGMDFAEARNFGPDFSGDASVGEVAQSMAQYWGGDASVELMPSSTNPHEACLLRLDSSAARARLNWRPVWSLEQALEATVLWHRGWLCGEDMQKFCLAQIDSYMAMRQS